MDAITVDSSNTAKYYPSPLPVEFQYISYVIELISKGVVCNKNNYCICTKIYIQNDHCVFLFLCHIARLLSVNLGK